MDRAPAIRGRPHILRLALGTLIFAAAPFREVAADPLGFYLGGTIGQSQTQADVSGFTGGEFKQNHSAFKIIAGARPISIVGLELAYIDLGHPRGDIDGFPADMKTKGASAFAVLYLPMPLPAFEFYAKAGIARLQSTLNSTNSRGLLPLACTLEFGCAYEPGPFPIERTNTGFAGGVGAQYKIGSWAVRVEYERFEVSGGNPTRLSLGNSMALGNPSLLSLGVTWTFL